MTETSESAEGPRSVNFPSARAMKFVWPLIFLASGFALYWQALSFGFLNYDDAFFVRDNPHLQAGLTWENVRWAFEANLLTVDRTAEYWMPLTMLSRLVDAQLFQGNAGLYHLQNVLLHSLNAWLVFLSLFALTGLQFRSALVAMLFLVHPQNTEVVCWIALRKDVLAGTVSLLTILLYVRYVQRPSLGRYLLTLLAFGAALLCKPSVLSLPLAVVLVDWWPLDRLRLTGSAAATVPARNSLVVVLCEKIPFLIMAVLASLVSMVGLHEMGFVAVGGEESISIRLGRTLVGYQDYLSRFLLVDSLCVLYPRRPWSEITSADLWRAGALLAGMTLATAALAFRKYRPPLMGWIWFVGLLLPASGLFQFGRQATADRYMYVPIIGLLILFVWIFADLLASIKPSHEKTPRRWLAILSGAASLALVLGLARLSSVQSRTWRNDSTLWQQAMLVEPDGEVAFNNFGETVSLEGNNKAAETYVRAALKIAPDSNEQLGNLGKALARFGNVDAAIPVLEKAIRSGPSNMEYHRWLVYALRRSGRVDDSEAAIARYEQLRGRSFLGAGMEYLRRGDLDLARAQFSLAFTSQLRARTPSRVRLEIAPTSEWLNDAREMMGRLPAAARASPERILSQAYLSYLAGDTRSAARWFGVAAEAQPDRAEGKWRQAVCLAELKQPGAESAAAAAKACHEPFEDGKSDWLFILKRDGGDQTSP